MNYRQLYIGLNWHCIDLHTMHRLKDDPIALRGFMEVAAEDVRKQLYEDTRRDLKRDNDDKELMQECARRLVRYLSKGNSREQVKKILRDEWAGWVKINNVQDTINREFQKI